MITASATPVSSVVPRTMVATAAGESPSPGDDEAALIARIRAGDQRACTDFVTHFGPRMLQAATAILRCEQDAADAVQDAFLSAFRGLDRFAGGSKLSTWLHRITVNACLMKVRARERRRARSDAGRSPAGRSRAVSFDEFDAARHLPCPRTIDPAERAEREEAVGALRRTVASLPAAYRQVLELRDLQMLDTTAAARRIGCTRANLKTRLHRARHALRERLTA